MVEGVPGAASPPFPPLHLVQVLTVLGLIFFHFFPGSLRDNCTVHSKGLVSERPGSPSPFVGGGGSLSASPGEGKPAPEVVTPVPSLLPPPPLRGHYRCPLLYRRLRTHSMAHFRKAYFDQRDWHKHWQRTQRRNKRFTVLNGEEGEKQQSEGSLPLALVPWRSVLATLP